MFCVPAWRDSVCKRFLSFTFHASVAFLPQLSSRLQDQSRWENPTTCENQNANPICLHAKKLAKFYQLCQTLSDDVSFCNVTCAFCCRQVSTFPLTLTGRSLCCSVVRGDAVHAGRRRTRGRQKFQRHKGKARQETRTAVHDGECDVWTGKAQCNLTQPQNNRCVHSASVLRFLWISSNDKTWRC